MCQPMSIELVAAVQQAIMRHPHYKDGPVTAFGYANVALKAADFATLKARIEELTLALEHVVDSLGYTKNEGQPPEVRECNSHAAWKIARAALQPMRKRP